MALPEFDKLLMQIRDGEHSVEVLDRAQTLLRVETRLPDELRGESLHDDPRSTAVAFLALLGHDDGFGDALFGALTSELSVPEAGVLSSGPVENVLNRPSVDDTLIVTAEMVENLEREEIPIAESVRFEAAGCDVVPSVLETLSLTVDLPIASAVRTLGGTVDLAKQVMTTLDIELLPVSEAVVDEADSVEVTPTVMTTLEIQTTPLAEAVLEEAGTVDIVDSVMQEVRGYSVVSIHDEAIVPANRPMWRFVGMAAAAAMFFAAIGVSMFSGSSEETGVVSNGFQFASASEIVVDDLSYDEEAFVQVIQDTDDKGEQALIIWIDDEAVL